MLYRETTEPDGVQERDSGGEMAEAQALADLGVTVLRYEPLDKRHLGLIRLLDECLKLPTLPMRSGFEPESIR